ncbi:MAG: ribosome small subunit-dependent GTPase A [Acidimicrobiales bacterium]
MTDPAGSTPSKRDPRTLAAWGFDHYFARLVEARELPGDTPGRILRADRRACLVALEHGEEHLRLSPQLLDTESSRPTTGDWVIVRANEVTAVLDRRTAVIRGAADASGRPQVLAANVEFVLVAEALGERWRPRHLERLLVVAWQSGAIPIVVLTKADRCADVPGAVRLATGIAPGVAVHAVSALLGSGTAELAAELARATTSVIIGRSGAGKSTFANVLSHGEAGLATNMVRADGKGRHTTVARELVCLANGALLIDTPGIRAIGLSDSAAAIEEAFNDVESLSLTCRFDDCAHDSEPGCSVTAAISAGELDNERLVSYRRLQREQERLSAREDQRLRAQKTAEWRTRSKELRRMQKH